MNVTAVQNIELSDDIVSLYNNSYDSLKNRVEESGFTPTYDDALIMLYGITMIVGALGLLLIAKKKLNFVLKK